MAQEEKHRNAISISQVLVVLGLIGGPLAVWGEAQLERGTTKEKIQQIERRQDDDRRDQRQNVNEVKEHVKVIDQNVQIILQKITAMEAVQRSERARR